MQCSYPNSIIIAMNNVKLDTDILSQIRHLGKCLRKDFDNKLAKYGLTGTQGRVLFYINCSHKQGKEIYQSDLETSHHLTKSSVSELLSRMIKNNLISKVKVKSRYSLIPTEKGKSSVDDILSERTEVIDKLFKGFTKEEIDMVSSLTQRMIENIEQEEKYAEKN